MYSDHAHPVAGRNAPATDAEVRWLERHYDELDPFDALERVQKATWRLVVLVNTDTRVLLRELEADAPAGAGDRVEAHRG